MSGRCPQCGGAYLTPTGNNGSVYPDPLIETLSCTTCGYTYQVVID